ncbi:MAG: AmmeMemoRadiSam system protein B [Desulfobacteraceae bacterium]|nr:AmmeMemoRadiSam system protein B [Desulfobacteraceae bacterium]
MSGIFARTLSVSAILVVFALFPIMTEPASGAPEPNLAQVQKPLLAGTWYPGSEQELRAVVKEFLSRVPPSRIDEKPIAIVSPHAGYVYSGQIAARSYAALQGSKFDSVIVIGPSHQVAFRGMATLDCAGFSTPLGVVPVDRTLMADLMKREPKIRNLPEPFAKEHSIEIQLPFLQSVLPGFKLVPIIMGEADMATCRSLADAIVDAIRGKSVLVVASSDLSHFHPYETANELDRHFVDCLKAMDVSRLYNCLETQRCEACGRGPVVTAMILSEKLGAKTCRVLDYANSGDVTGEKASPRGVVGYVAAAFLKSTSDRDKSENKRAGIDLGLSDADKAKLHAIAREVIESKCLGTKPVGQAAFVTSPKLKEHRGAFVTINKKGQLRGCIGQVVATQPLADSVAEMAEAAALHDPRFSPLRPDELPDITIEISVLTPFEKMQSPDEIVIGKHGLIIRRGISSGLLLPQVASDYGWDAKTFLEQTCVKAGLPKDAWKDKNTEIYLFSADVF